MSNAIGGEKRLVCLLAFLSKMKQKELLYKEVFFEQKESVFLVLI